jgi:hypothetical protein
MTRRLLFALFAVLAFGAGIAAAQTFYFQNMRVTAERPIFSRGKITPLSAYFVTDEWNGIKACIRVIYHRDTGQFAAQDVDLAFCEPWGE